MTYAFSIIKSECYLGKSHSKWRRSNTDTARYILAASDLSAKLRRYKMDGRVRDRNFRSTATLYPRLARINFLVRY